jgi:hypothetical protein
MMTNDCVTAPRRCGRLIAGSPREPEPSTINEKTVADFTRPGLFQTYRSGDTLMGVLEASGNALYW